MTSFKFAGPSRQVVLPEKFNPVATLPYGLRVEDFTNTMQGIYDYLYSVNTHFGQHGMPFMEDVQRQANYSGTISDMLADHLGRHAASLAVNQYHNGHPDLLVDGMHPSNAQRSSTDGVEIKATRKRGGAVDTHGGREQWMCVFVYEVDNDPATRRPMRFTEVYLGHVTADDFRRNERGQLGTRTSTLDRDGIAKLRRSWVYLDRD